ncbi:type II toxin-antitoxin system RelE/ParE family toxin [uncultured Adlercreutzia sp.]|uniref:type II toxin-antitoxin system RelE/ParE family toxin n=1 Tax=uncultured Adlercreutzia sp. TaxID=875803 RepID=UPI0025EC4FD2|nr:type II toxin-antitoxin system RelE/ParE family toxin [uncultured Adlercreutzia sp.]MCI9261878.1 type II toxin-antitoxin system RelE/ParE family toxin [Eggerthellaceae bacterium]
MRYEIELYETDQGSCPVSDFLGGLPPKLRRKTTTYLEVLEEGGPDLREPYTKPLGKGIFELRCQWGSESVRLLFFYCGSRVIVVTNGFLKKTRKTPLREIRLAEMRRGDYLRRYGYEA